MTKFFDDFRFGLAFGCGFLLAYALLALIRWFLGHAQAVNLGM